MIYATIDVAAVVAGVARGEEIFKNSCLGPLPIHWPIPKKERVVDFNPARARNIFSLALYLSALHSLHPLLQLLKMLSRSSARPAQVCT